MNFSTLGLLAPLLLLVQVHLCTSQNRYCQVAVDSVTIVESCPTTKTEWDAAARIKNCSRIASSQKCSSVDQFVYHCVINGYRNVTLDVCAPSRIIFGHCVEFNVGGGVIQDQRSALCNNTFPKCDRMYDSTDAYRYTDCYKLVSLSKTTYSTTTTTSRTNTIATAATASTKQPTTFESNSTEIIGIIAAVVSVTFILLIVAIIVVYKRRCKEKRQRVPDGEVPGGEALEEINCTEEAGMIQRGCETDALSSAHNLNDTREEQNKCQNPATDIQTKDSRGCERTRTYSS